VLRFSRDLPIEGKPAGVYETMGRAHEALASARYPKLLFVGDPGALVSPAFADSFADSLPIVPSSISHPESISYRKIIRKRLAAPSQGGSLTRRSHNALAALQRNVLISMRSLL
jgi:hypothetical protein